MARTDTLVLDAINDKSENWLEIAVEYLKSDECVALPTETVYGLAANATSEMAAQRIFAAKGRPSDNPLIVHVSSLSMLYRFLLEREPPSDMENLLWLPPVYRDAIAQFWPGALTLLFAKPPSCPVAVTSSSPLVAVRWPSHPVMSKIISSCGFPLAAPSANISGKPSPTLAAHVYDDLHGRIPCIVDGGPCQWGLESTIVNGLCEPPQLLRPGGIALEDLRRISSLSNIAVNTDAKTASALTPGMRYRHYSPDAIVHLLPLASNFQSFKSLINERLHSIRCQFPSARIGILTHSLIDSERDEIQKAQSHALPPPAIVAVFSMSEVSSKENPKESFQEVAHNIFALLRDMDRLQMSHILVEQVPTEREGLAVMNRLLKATTD